jgi:hypothetical protein
MCLCVWNYDLPKQNTIEEADTFVQYDKMVESHCWKRPQRSHNSAL